MVVRPHTGGKAVCSWGNWPAWWPVGRRRPKRKPVRPSVQWPGGTWDSGPAMR